MRDHIQDFRFAVRQLRKSPVYVAVAILTLALGIGANTAIVSVAKAVLLTQLPSYDPDRLVRIAESSPDAPRPETVDFTTAHDLRRLSHSFQRMSLFRLGVGMPGARCFAIRRQCSASNVTRLAASRLATANGSTADVAGL